MVLGHSMGSLVAFEVTRALQAAGHTPRGLIASACRAPVLPNQCPVHPELLDDDQLVAAIKERGGTDDGILDEPELREIVLPSIRATSPSTTPTGAPSPTSGSTARSPSSAADADPIVPVDMLGGWSLVAGVMSCRRFSPATTSTSSRTCRASSPPQPCSGHLRDAATAAG
ncbi:thioesterase II family protein [Kitasatospora cinereorecta]